MTTRVGHSLLVGAGLLYLVLLSWAMSNLAYDVWGAFVLAPIYGVIGILGLRAMFSGEMQPLATVMSWGLLIKFGGALARYWVGFEAYAGIDAGEYDKFAVARAGEVWAGERSFLEALPSGTGTHFVEQFTSSMYMLTGGSRLAGFVTFSFLAYIGLVFMVKAAAIAVPGMAIRKYAWLCVLFPTIVYWPSSIGKEALMMLGLGVGTYGVATLLSRRTWFASVLLIGVGVGFSALIRPHMSGIWLAGALPALLLLVLLGSRSLTADGERQRVSRVGLIGVLVIAAISLTVISQATLEFLEPRADDPTSSALTEILNETTRRTAQAGSNFVPPSISSPTDWPFAAVRTLTRPLPNEANGLAQLLSAAEMTALLGLFVVSWRRALALPKMMVTNPYVAFAMTTVFLGGLAFASFANLGVLTRQKSLLFPFLLLIPCLPALRRRPKRAPSEGADDRSRLSIEAGPIPPAADAPVAPPDRSSPVPAVRHGHRRRPADVALVDDLWD